MQRGRHSPLPSLAVAETVDAIASDAARCQDLLCYLRVQSLQRCQSIALNLRSTGHRDDDRCRVW